MANDVNKLEFWHVLYIYMYIYITQVHSILMDHNWLYGGRSLRSEQL